MLMELRPVVVLFCQFEGIDWEALGIARAIGNRLMAGTGLAGLGYALAETGRESEAEDSFREGLEIGTALNGSVQVAEASAGLASVLLKRGHAKEARELLEPFLFGIGEGMPHGVAEPFAPDLTWIRVLRANEDPRWRPALEVAHARLREARGG